MEHLVADVELEGLAATRIQEFGLGSRQAQRDELRASGLRPMRSSTGRSSPHNPRAISGSRSRSPSSVSS